MATTTRQAAWRTGGAANGWHDDLVWYAAAIHQMRLLSPGYDDFLALYDQNPGATSQLANIAPAVVGPAESRLPVPGPRHVRERGELAQPRRQEGVVAGVRPQPVVLPAVAPGVPAGVRGHRARSRRGPRWSVGLGPALLELLRPRRRPAASGAAAAVAGGDAPVRGDGAGRRRGTRRDVPQPAVQPDTPGAHRRRRSRLGDGDHRAAPPALRQPGGHGCRLARRRGAGGPEQRGSVPSRDRDRHARHPAARIDARRGRRHDEPVRDGRARPGVLDAPRQHRPAVGDLRQRSEARLPVHRQCRSRHGCPRLVGVAPVPLQPAGRDHVDVGVEGRDRHRRPRLRL